MNNSNQSGVTAMPVTRRQIIQSTAALGLLGILPPFSAVAQAGRVLHVDHDGGDDSRDGFSRETARRTTPGPGLLAPGDRVLFKGGVRYRGVIEASKSGTPEAPIIYDGNSRGEWGEGPAIIDGSEPLMGWSPAEDIAGAPIWLREAPPSSPTTLLVHQGTEVCAVAQLPELARLDEPEDLSKYFPYVRQWHEAIEGERAHFLEAPDALGEGSGDLTRGALVRLHVTGNFVRVYAVIGHDPVAGVVRLAPKPVGGRGSPPDGSKLKRFALVNTRSGLRRPGQFVIEDGKLLLRPHGDIDPARAELTVARQQDGIKVSSSHVQVRGFRIEKLRAGAGVTGRNGASDRLTGLRVVGVVVARSRVSRGIWFERCDDSVVYGCHVHDLLEGRGVLLTNCMRTSLAKNRIERIAGSCLSVFGGHDCVVMGNHIGDPLGVHSNGMSFYMGNRGTKVFFNTVLIPEARAFAMTMQDAGGMTVAFNTLVSRDFASFSHHPDKGHGGGEEGGHAWVNNLILTTADNRAFRVASPKALEGSMLLNNIADGFAVNGTAPDPFRLRTRNVYTRRRDGALSVDQLREIGEFIGEREAMFMDLENWDLRPSQQWRETLGRGAPYEIDGVRVDWIGRYRPDGTEAWDWDAAGAP